MFAKYSMARVSKKLKMHNDSNLNQKFVWKLKIERDIDQGMSLENFSSKAEKKRKREIIAEIEKVKKGREQRAIEKARRDEEIALLDRERAGAEFRDWEKKEAEFQFGQSKIRSEIRVREGRMKPIDILANQLHPSIDHLDIEIIDEPCMLLKDLTVKEVEELRQDIKLYMDFYKEMTMHKQYWEALLVLCDWEIAEVRKKDALDRAINGKQLPLELLVEERAMQSSIEIEVKNLLEGQTYGELEALQSKIEALMLSGAAKVVEYWEAVLKRIPVFKAKAVLKDIHAKMLREHIECLEKPLEKDANFLPLKPTLEEENKGVDEFEKKSLNAMGEMEEGDSIFGLKDEVHLDSQVPWWHDKYCPRKPLYFNRVLSRYEWNKYNQSHYDYENPPSKSVQGYKFNIFYPDIVDGSKVPTYIIEKDGDSTETCIIRFHAGAPYEDIAFRIVNQEWEFSRKKGFKCTFERGILQLYFNLKRFRYRR